MVKASQGGDKKAYEQFLGLLYPYIRNLIGQKIGPIVDIEDLTQEILLGVHKNLATYHSSRPFKPWLSAIIRYKLMDYFRRRSRNKENFVGEDVTKLEVPANSTVESSASAVTKVIEALPEKLRRALVMTQLEGLTYSEAAQKEGVSEEALRKRVSRAYKQLRLEVKNQRSITIND